MTSLLAITARRRTTWTKTLTQWQRARASPRLMETRTTSQMGPRMWLNIESGLESGWRNVGLDVRFPWTINGVIPSFVVHPYRFFNSVILFSISFSGEVSFFYCSSLVNSHRCSKPTWCSEPRVYVLVCVCNWQAVVLLPLFYNVIQFLELLKPQCVCERETVLKGTRVLTQDKTLTRVGVRCDSQMVRR